MSLTLESRFWSKVDADGDCWEWIAGRNTAGYGMYSDNGRDRVAHRVAYEMLVGPIPEGLTLDHLCRNVRCVNPDHLEPVTMRENLLRGYGPAGKHARQTHCKYGHLLITPKPGSQRLCRECRNARNAKTNPKRDRRRLPLGNTP